MPNLPRPTSLAQAVVMARSAHRLSHVAARAPEPLSDDEIVRILASTPRRPPSNLAPDADASTIAEKLELPLIEGVDLATLTNRFEHSLARRKAVVQAEEAHQTLTANLPLARPNDALRAALRAQHTVTAVTASASTQRDHTPGIASERSLGLSGDVEDALGHALATLRALAQQGRR